MALHVNYEFRWKNYRGFVDTGWLTIRPLTLLIGPNNSGKTSVTSPLLLMNQTVSSRDSVTPLVTRGPLVDAGAFKDIIHDRNVANELFLGLRFHVHDPDRRLKKVGTYPPGAVEVVLAAGDRPGEILLRSYELFDIYKRPFLSQTLSSDGTYRLEGVAKEGMTPAELTALTQSKPINFLFSPSSTVAQYYQQSKNSDADNLGKTFSRSFSSYLTAISFTYEHLRYIFSTLSYIGPLRARPKRYYEIAGEIPRSVGPRGENTANLLHRRLSTMRAPLNKWIRRFELETGS